jgi:hypothetical protein
MKKLALMILGVMAAGVVHAQALTGSGVVTRVTCTLLNEDVNINLSNNVMAGVACDTTQIVISTCSLGGRTADRSAERNTPVGCDTDVNVDCTGTEVYTVTGAEMPTATTQYGTVVKQYPGTTCDDAAANAETYANSKL